MGCPQRHFGSGCMWMCTLYWLPTEALCNWLHVDVHSVLVAHGGFLYGLPTEPLRYWLHVDVHSVLVAHGGLPYGLPTEGVCFGCMWMCTLYGFAHRGPL